MKYLFLLVVLVSPGLCQTWGSLAKYENFTEYFPNLMQETIYELERREWCNLKIDDISVNISQNFYDMNFVGTVNFSNGFVVSMQHIDMTDVSQNFFTGSISGTTTGTMLGTLNFRDVVVGYDVIANLEDQGVQRFTGTYLYNLIEYNIRVAKNMNTDEITVTAELKSLSAGNYLIMMPDNDIADILTRFYAAGNANTSVGRWGTSIIVPIIQELIGKLGFPTICFNC